MSQPVTEHTLMPIELTLSEWQSVMTVLNEGTHRVVAPLITKIGQQFQQFVNANNPPAS